MNHVPDEILAAIALGDDEVSTPARDHVDGCPVCSHEVAELAQVHALVRDELATDGAQPAAMGPVVPGAQVWRRIAAETGADPEAAETTDKTTANTTDKTTVVAPAGMPVIALADRRRSRHLEVAPRRRRWWVAAAAAACVAAGALVGHALWAGNVDRSTVVSTVALTTLDPTHQKEGTAELLEARGVRELKVDATSMPPAASGSGYVEVWLINADGKRMVSLGTLASPQGTFAVPPGAIEQGYTVVDLSREQYDDRPQHSGDSIMRGVLPA